MSKIRVYPRNPCLKKESSIVIGMPQIKGLKMIECVKSVKIRENPRNPCLKKNPVLL